MVPIYLISAGATEGCWRAFEGPDISQNGKPNAQMKFVVYGFLFEMVALVSTFVLGILALLNVLHTPSTAAYSLMGAGGAILFSYGLLGILVKRGLISGMEPSDLTDTLKSIPQVIRRTFA